MMDRLALHRIRPGSHPSQHCPGKRRHVRAGPVQVAKVIRRQGSPAQLSGFCHAGEKAIHGLRMGCGNVI